MADEDKRTLPFFVSQSEREAWVGYWHAHRRVLVIGELNRDSLKKTEVELLKLDYKGSDPILLMIQSSGGKVTPTHQLEDIIGVINSPVDALVIGDCASMAVDLVLMCRRRMMLPSARMLVHYIRNDQLWIVDDAEQLETDIQYFRERMREMSERRMSLYMRRTGLTRERLKELFRHGEVHEAYFSAQQAIKLGFADEIATNFKLFPRRAEEDKK